MLSGIIYARIQRCLTASERRVARRVFFRALGKSGFVSEGDENDPEKFQPMNPIDDMTSFPMSTHPGAWYDLNIAKRYFDADYPLGDIWFYLACAALLRALYPDCQVWYGYEEEELFLLNDDVERQLVQAWCQSRIAGDVR